MKYISQETKNHGRSHSASKWWHSPAILCKVGQILLTGWFYSSNEKKLGLLIIVTQRKMSPWHDILISHLRNGSFQEENHSLLLPPPSVSFLAMVLRSGSDKGLQSQGAGRRQKHRRKAFLHFHSTAIAVKITRGEGRAKKLRKWSYRTKTLEWFVCRQLVEIKSFWVWAPQNGRPWFFNPPQIESTRKIKCLKQLTRVFLWGL